MYVTVHKKVLLLWTKYWNGVCVCVLSSTNDLLSWVECPWRDPQSSSKPNFGYPNLVYDQPQNLNFTWRTEQTFHFWWQHFCRCNHSHYLLHQNLFTETKKHLQCVKEFLCPWPCNLCMHPLVRVNAAHTPHAWNICWASEEAPNHRFSCTHTSRIDINT